MRSPEGLVSNPARYDPLKSDHMKYLDDLMPARIHPAIDPHYARRVSAA